MKYFTRGWINGELGDEAFDQVSEAYRQRLAEIEPRLTPALRELTRTNLHDAVVERITWTPHLGRLVVDLLLLEKSPDRYLAARLRYEGALLGVRRIDVLRQVARDRQTTVLCDEVDLDDDGIFAHRLLFWPRDEVTLCFSELYLELSPREDRRVNLGPAFLELRPDEDWPEPPWGSNAPRLPARSDAHAGADAGSSSGVAQRKSRQLVPLQ